MSRSRRKSPVVTHGSGKYFKQQANRALRRKVKVTLKQYPDIEILPLLKEVSNIYDSNKDGSYHMWLDKYEHIGRGCFWQFTYLMYMHRKNSSGYRIIVKKLQETKEEEYAERLTNYKKAMRK